MVNMVTLYKVNRTAFDSCDISGGMRIGQVKSGDASAAASITLSSTLFSAGDNYLLGRYQSIIFYIIFTKI